MHHRQIHLVLSSTVMPNVNIPKGDDRNVVTSYTASSLLLMWKAQRHTSEHMNHYQELSYHPDNEEEEESKMPLQVIAEAIGAFHGPNADKKMMTAIKFSVFWVQHDLGRSPREHYEWVHVQGG